MSLWAFQITGVVDAETRDEACAAIAAYCDPASDDDPSFEDETPVRSIRFRWNDVAGTALETAAAIFEAAP